MSSTESLVAGVLAIVFLLLGAAMLRPRASAEAATSALNTVVGVIVAIVGAALGAWSLASAGLL